jgi:hypothetical protein
MSEKPVLRPILARREFMKLSSVAVAGLAASSLPSAAFGALRGLPKALMTAGFSAVEPKEGEVVWLTPAERLLSGDSQFISRDARVTICSSVRAASQSVKAGGSAIDFVFPALGYQPDAYPTYRAWSYRQDGSSQYPSAAVAFRVPIVATQGLQLVFSQTIESKQAKPATAAESMLALSLGSSSSNPKLQRGTYVVAYSDYGDNAAQPNWSVVPITRQGNKIIVPDAKFSYLLLSVDYAS